MPYKVESITLRTVTLRAFDAWEVDTRQRGQVQVWMEGQGATTRPAQCTNTGSSLALMRLVESSHRVQPCTPSTTVRRSGTLHPSQTIVPCSSTRRSTTSTVEPVQYLVLGVCVFRWNDTYKIHLYSSTKYKYMILHPIFLPCWVDSTTDHTVTTQTLVAVIVAILLNPSFQARHGMVRTWKGR